MFARTEAETEYSRLFGRNLANSPGVQNLGVEAIYAACDIAKEVGPVPGGGSAAALVAATGVALILMVANYSVGKTKSKNIETRLRNIIKKGTALRRRLIALVDLDAQTYMDVVRSRQAYGKAGKTALRKAVQVSREVCRLCYKAIELTPFLVEKGNKNLISDIEVAAEMMLAAFNSAMSNVEANS